MDSFNSETQFDSLMKNTKTKPVHEIRLGHIKAAVWRNETEAGVRYNATFSRLYRDGELLTEARSTLACIDRQGNVQRIPEVYVEMM